MQLVQLLLDTVDEYPPELSMCQKGISERQTGGLPGFHTSKEPIQDINVEKFLHIVEYVLETHIIQEIVYIGVCGHLQC